MGIFGALNVGIFGASVEQIGALDQIPLYEHNNDFKKRWVSEGDKSSLAKKYICGGGELMERIQGPIYEV